MFAGWQIILFIEHDEEWDLSYKNLLKKIESNGTMRNGDREGLKKGSIVWSWFLQQLK